MNEAIYSLIGVVIGSFIPLLYSYATSERIRKKNARYLAIRLVCILDKFMEDCTEVVKDDGLSFGQRTQDGYLIPQVKAPGAPIYPEDVDWKTIDHELMYQILSLPSDVEAAERNISFTENHIAEPPDHKELFEERRFHYSKLGLAALSLSQKLSKKYDIRPKNYNDWNPQEELLDLYKRAIKDRETRIRESQNIVQRISAKIQNNADKAC